MEICSSRGFHGGLQIDQRSVFHAFDAVEVLPRSDRKRHLPVLVVSWRGGLVTVHGRNRAAKRCPGPGAKSVAFEKPVGGLTGSLTLQPAQHEVAAGVCSGN